MEAWRGLTHGAAVTLRYHELSGGTTTAQVLQFYRDVAGVPVANVVVDMPPGEYDLDASQVAALWASVTTDVLAVGVLFRFYSFGAPAARPPRGYSAAALKNGSLYAAIVSAWAPAPDIVRAAAAVRALAAGPLPGTGLACVHLRRRDFRAKCKHFVATDATDVALLRRCLLPLDDVAAGLSAAIHAHDAHATAAKPWAVFVSTDAPDDSEVAALAVWATSSRTAGNATWRVSLWTGNVSAALKLGHAAPDSLDTPLHWALLDQEVCAHTDVFVANGFSSFSSAVLDRRTLAGRLNWVL